jgi:hypothetical protein
MTGENKEASFDANKKYKDAEADNKNNTAVDMEEAKKLKATKPEAKFAPMTEDDYKKIDKLLNDKKQNRIQAIKQYFQTLLVKKQMDLFQKRFEEAVEAGVEIKDDYGLVRSKEELKIEAMRNYIQLKFINSELVAMLDDFKTTWGMNEDSLDKCWQEWFVQGRNID